MVTVCHYYQTTPDPENDQFIVETSLPTLSGRVYVNLLEYNLYKVILKYLFFYSWGSFVNIPEAFILSISSFRIACFQARLNSWYSWRAGWNGWPLASSTSLHRLNPDDLGLHQLNCTLVSRLSLNVFSPAPAENTSTLEGDIKHPINMSQPKWKMALHLVDLLWSIVYTWK